MGVLHLQTQYFIVVLSMISVKNHDDNCNCDDNNNNILINNNNIY